MFNRIKILARIIKEFILKAAKGSLGYAISQGLNCGKGVVVSRGTGFGSEPYLITLHDNVRLSSNVSLITHDGSVHTINLSGRYDKHLDIFGKIEIGENTFIGANATVLPNVSIGKNCIIAAGAVVTRSIPDDAIVAGVPGKIIGNTWEFAERRFKMQENKKERIEDFESIQEYLKAVVPEPPKA